MCLKWFKKQKITDSDLHYLNTQLTYFSIELEKVHDFIHSLKTKKGQEEVKRSLDRLRVYQSNMAILIGEKLGEKDE